MEAAVRLITDLAGAVDLVGLGVTEYMPREALRLQSMLQRLPLIGSI
jgi:arginase